MAARKLRSGEWNLLGLIRKQRDEDGWAKVSATVMPMMLKMPRELVMSEYVPSDFSPGGGRARLTIEGEKVLDVAAWFGTNIIG